MGALLLGGCSSGSEPAAKPSATPCPSLPPVTDLSLAPKDIDLSAYGDVVTLEVKRGFLLAVIHSDMLIVEADPPLQRALIASGYEVLSHDNEGFEAEIFFARGPEVVGTFTFRELCAGKIKISLVYGSDRYEKMSS